MRRALRRPRHRAARKRGLPGQGLGRKRRYGKRRKLAWQGLRPAAGMKPHDPCHENRRHRRHKGKDNAPRTGERRPPARPPHDDRNPGGKRRHRDPQGMAVKFGRAPGLVARCPEGDELKHRELRLAGHIVADGQRAGPGNERRPDQPDPRRGVPGRRQKCCQRQNPQGQKNGEDEPVLAGEQHRNALAEAEIGQHHQRRKPGELGHVQVWEAPRRRSNRGAGGAQVSHGSPRCWWNSKSLPSPSGSAENRTENLDL